MKKFLSYVFTFVLLFVIAAATTVSVSYFDNSGTNLQPLIVDSEASNTSLFTGILSSFENNKQFNFQGDITLEGEEQSLPVLLYVNVDIADTNNVKVEGLLKLAGENLNLLIEFGYYNSTIYLSYNDVNIKMTAKTIKDLVDEITDLLPKEEEESEGEAQESLLDSLLPKIMESLNSMSENELEGGDKQIELSIESLADVVLITSSEDVPKNVKLKTAEYNGYKINADIDIEFNENIVIVNPETVQGVEYVDVNVLREVVENTAKLADFYANVNLFVGSGVAVNNVGFNLLANLKNNNFSLELCENSYGYIDNAKITYYNKNLYVDFGENINLLVSENLIDNVAKSVEAVLYKYVPELANLSDCDVVSQLSSSLEVITKEDIVNYLGYLKNIELTNNKLIIELSGDLFETSNNLVVEIGFEGGIISGLSVSGLIVDGKEIELLATISETQEKVAVYEEEKYLDVYNIYLANKDYYNTTALAVNFNASISSGKLAGTVIVGEVRFDANQNYLELSANISGNVNLNLSVYMFGETGYICLDNIKVKATKTQIEEFLEKYGLKDVLDSQKDKYVDLISNEITNFVDNHSLEDIIDSIRNIRINSEEISLVVDGSLFGLEESLCLKVGMANNIVNSLTLSNVMLESARVSASVEIVSNEVIPAEIDEKSYLDVFTLLENVENLANTTEGSLYASASIYKNNGEYYNAYLELKGSLEKEFLSLYFNLDGGLKFNANVVYVDNVCYLNIGGVYVSIKEQSIQELLNFLLGDNLTSNSLGSLDISGKVNEVINSLSLADLKKIKEIEINSSYISLKIDSSIFGLNGDIVIRLALNNNMLSQLEIINLNAGNASINLSLSLSLTGVSKPMVSAEKYLSLEKFVNSAETILVASDLGLTANVDVYTLVGEEYVCDFGVDAKLSKQTISGELNANLSANLLFGETSLSLTMAYLRNTIFAEFNGLKVKLEKDSIVGGVHIILDMLGKDQNAYDDILYAFIDILEGKTLLDFASLNDLSLVTLVSQLNISNINVDMASVLNASTLKTILEGLNNIKLNANEITLTLSGESFGIEGNIEIIITLENSAVKAICINKLYVGGKFIDINVEFGEATQVGSISKEEEENYIDLYQLAKVARATYKTLENGVISGNFTLKFDYKGETNFVNVEYGIKLVQKDIVAYLKTNFKGLDVNVYYMNGTFYLDIVGLKIYVEFNELGDVIDFLNSEFGLNIDIDVEGAGDLLDLATNLNVNDIISNLSDMNLDIFESVVFGEYSAEAVLKSGLTIFVSYNETINQIRFTTSDILVELNCESFDDFVLTQVDVENYQHYEMLVEEYRLIKSTIITKQYSLLAGVEVYKQSELEYDISANMAVDIVSEFNMNAHVNIKGNNELNVNVAFQDNILYFDYDNLKLCINQINLKEILVIILEAVGVDANQIGFLASVAENMEINTDNLSNVMPSVDFGNPLNMLKIIKSMSLSENRIELLLKGSEITGSENASDMQLIVTTNETGVESVQLLNIYTGSGDESFNLDLTFGEYNGVESVDSPETYIDISESSGLLKAFVNTSNLSDYSISGTIQVEASVIGIDIDMDVPVTAQVKVVDGKIEAYACLDIPVIGSNVPGFTDINVNNDVPYKTGDTSVQSRRLEIMYKDGYFYFYRKDVVQRTVFATRTYEKKLKIAYQELMDDPMTYLLQYGFGFSDAIMEKINEAVDKAKNRTTPIDYSNILLGYSKVDNNQHQVVLNLGEIANNDQLGNASINIYTINNDQTNQKDYLYKLVFDINMPIASSFQLDLKTDDLTLINIGDEVDMQSMYSYIDAYTYGENQQYEASNGSWSLASEKTYTIDFVDNVGNNNVSSIEATVNSAITLPWLANFTTDDGITQTTYTFTGWYTSETCEESTKYSSLVMTRGDKTLYAGWQKTIVNYITITFNSMGGEDVNSITALEQSEIVLPSLENKIVIEGQTKITYAFTGWFVDSSLSVKFEETIMPNQNTTLYAGWAEVERYVAYLLNVYDNGSLVYSEYVGEGSAIAITGTQIDSYTKFYLDSDYKKEYSVGTMPSSDLTLYVLNRYALTIISEYGNVYNTVEYHYQGEAVTIPSQSSYTVDDYGVTYTTYTFNGWQNSIAYMPNSNTTVTASWTINIKHYYTITFHLDWYKSAKITQEATTVTNTTDNKLTVLEGTTINLSTYTSTLKAKIIREKTYKTTSWSTTQITSSIGELGADTINTIENINQNYDLYAVWGEA